MDTTVHLTKIQVAFLMSRFKTKTPDDAVEAFVEQLVLEGKDPLKLSEHVNRLMAKENN